jgi:hypothetical protein
MMYIVGKRGTVKTMYRRHWEKSFTDVILREVFEKANVVRALWVVK